MSGRGNEEIRAFPAPHPDSIVLAGLAASYSAQGLPFDPAASPVIGREDRLFDDRVALERVIIVEEPNTGHDRMSSRFIEGCAGALYEDQLAVFYVVLEYPGGVNLPRVTLYAEPYSMLADQWFLATDASLFIAHEFPIKLSPLPDFSRLTRLFRNPVRATGLPTGAAAVSIVCSLGLRSRRAAWQDEDLSIRVGECPVSVESALEKQDQRTGGNGDREQHGK